jgi:hypothetical protein
MTPPPTPGAAARATTIAPPVVTPTTAAPTVLASIGVSPASAPMTYLRPNAPVLTWSTDGPAALVEVSGPNFSSASATGSAPVCPTSSAATWSFCVASAGPVNYTITARAADGSILATATATLTIA